MVVRDGVSRAAGQESRQWDAGQLEAARLEFDAQVRRFL